MSAQSTLHMSLSLRDFVWQSRLLLIFSPNAHNPAYMAQNLLLTNEAVELKARDILVFHLFDSEPGVQRQQRFDRQVAAELRHRFAVGKDEFAVLLIGLDGRVKHRTYELLFPLDLYRLIDGNGAAPFAEQVEHPELPETLNYQQSWLRL